jgi:hypothetical protein
MNAELSERDKDTDTQERRVYDRANSGVRGERKCKRKKNDGEI